MSMRESFVDGRYTVRLEYTGQAEPQWVARFEGTWIGQAATKIEARRLAFRYHNRRTQPR